MKFRSTLLSKYFEKGLHMTRRMLTVAQVMWPAFLVAGILEMVVFSWVDPSMFHFGDWHPEPTAAYSLMFMVFWVAVSVGAFLSHWLMSGTTQQERHLPHMGA
jgi:hypothetical protein